MREHPAACVCGHALSSHDLNEDCLAQGCACRRFSAGTPSWVKRPLEYAVLDEPDSTAYQTVVVDPPWPYKHKKSGVGFGHGRTGVMLDVAMPYPTLSVPEICALPVPEWSSPDSHLYLWTTQRFLPDAYSVLRSWGFSPSAVLVWSKPAMGVVGTYVCSTEFCLFARRGSLPALSRQIGTCFPWSRGRHSEKPEPFFDLVEQVSPGPYLELFARRKRLGWDAWGDEVDSDIDFMAKAPCFACSGPSDVCDCAGEGSENPHYGPGNPDWERDRQREAG